MKIKEIYFKGFRVFKDEVLLTFDSEYILFLGGNGNGKSSVVKYIDLNLLNHISESDLSRDHLIHRSSDRCDSYLIFEHRGGLFKSSLSLIREGKSAQTSRELVNLSTNESLGTETSQVVDILAKMFDPVISRHAIALRQNSKEIITSKPADRFNIFKKVLDVTFVEAIQIVEREIKKLNEEISSIRGKLLAYKERDYSPLPIPETNLSEKAYNSLVEEVTLLREKKTLLSEIKKSYDSLKTDIDTISDRISLTDASISRKTRLLDFAKSEILSESAIIALPTIVEISNNVLNLEKSLQALSKDTYLERAKSKLVLERKAIEDLLLANEKSLELYPRKRALSDKTDEFSDKIQDLKDILSKYLSEICHLDERIAFMKKGVCSECGSHIDSSDLPKLMLEKDLKISAKIDTENLINIEKDALLKHKEDLANERAYLLSRETLLNKNTSLKESLESLSKQEATLLEGALAEFNSDKVLLESKIESEKLALSTAISNAQTLSDNKKKEVTNLLEDIASLEQDKTAYTEDLDKKNRSLSEISLPDLSQIDIDLISKDTSITKYEEELKNRDTTISNNALLEAQEKSDKEKVQTLNKELDILDAKLAMRVTAKKVLEKDLPSYIISETVQNITSSINSFIEDVYTKPLNISLRPTATSLKMEADGLPVSSVSGAEEVITCLGFVDAIREFTDLDQDTIILDESDAALDDENAVSLFEAIDNLDYEQVIIVTHSSSMKEYFLNRGAKGYLFKDGNVEEI